MDETFKIIAILTIYFGLLAIATAAILRSRYYNALVLPYIAIVYTVAENVFMFLHILIYNDNSVAYYAPMDYLIDGAIINYVYLCCWLLGYLVVISHGSFHEKSISLIKETIDPAYARTREPAQLYASYFLLLLGLASTAYFMYRVPYYGWSQNAYAFGGVENLGVHSIFSAYTVFLPAILVVLILFDKSRKTIMGIDLKIIFLILLVIVSIIGLVYFSKRSKFILPLFLFALGLILTGKKKAFIYILLSAFIFLVISSPFANTYRKGKVRFSTQKVMADSKAVIDDVFYSGEYWEKLSWGLGSYSLAALTSGLLRDNADIHGFAWLRPYRIIPYSLIPTIITSKKYYPGSFDGTPITAPNFIAGKRLLNYGVTAHVYGGGVGYWQGGWIFVILNGFVAGAFFSTLYKIVLRSNNLLHWIFMLSMLGYGNVLVNSADLLLYSLIKKLQVFLPVICVYYFIIFNPNRRQPLEVMEEG